VNDVPDNTAINRSHYDAIYKNVNAERLIDSIKRWRDTDGSLERWLQDASATHMSWHGIYDEGFAPILRGKRVLELGSGDGSNACVMAALGADVTAHDVSTESMQIITLVASSAGLSNLRAVPGDFLTLPLDEGSYDFVVGKAFLHHLTHDIEAAFLKRIARLLAPGGQARFVESATNSALLDRLRWLFPVPGRPSALNRRAFERWKENDPHPDRENSAAHYLAVGHRFFEDVRIVPLGSLERFHRLMPRGRFQRRYRQWAHRIEERLPMWFRLPAARSQTIILRRPKIQAQTRSPSPE
jgi:2-polyprenyl-3-methyl-5-hydroxy-6-metoxy-1,4-benzoquinol methylase